MIDELQSLPEPDGVETQESQLFIGSHVSCQEAANVRVTRISSAIYRMSVVEWKQRFAVVVGDSLSQTTKVIGQVPQ